MTTGRKEASGKLALRGEFLPQQAFAQIEALTAKLKDSHALPDSIKNPAQLMMVFLAGYEAGMSPMQSISSYYIVNGKVTIYGEAVMRQLRQAGFSAEWLESTKEKATVKITDNKKGSITETFTFEEAKEAGLTHKDNWKKYPKDLLRWKALGRAVRFFCPEVLGGFYMKEEAEDFNGIDVQAKVTETVEDTMPGVTLDAAPAQPQGYDEAVAVWENYGKLTGWNEAQAYGVLGKTLMRYYGKDKLTTLSDIECEDFTKRIEEAYNKLETENNAKAETTTDAPADEDKKPEEETTAPGMTQDAFAEGLGAKVDTKKSK